jgi:fatty aldehyde-generating acyl-ACP reductase
MAMNSHPQLEQASPRLSSFEDRRREPRKLGHGAVMLNTLGLLRRRRLAAVIDYSNAGLSLTGELKGLTIATAANVELFSSGATTTARIQCRWVKIDNSRIVRSGWVVAEKDRPIFHEALESAIYANQMPVLRERREIGRRQGASIATLPERNPIERRLTDNRPISPLEFFPEDLRFFRQHDRRSDNGSLNATPNDINNRKSERRSPFPRPPIVYKHTVAVTLWKILLAFRDLFIFLLPRIISSRFLNMGDFAFITHPRDTDDIQRQFPLLKLLPERIMNIWLKYQWPVVGAHIEGVKNRLGQDVKGWLIFCPLTARQMIRDRELAKKRVLATVKLASNMGLKIVGLGAFTSIVTRDGLDVVDHHPLNVTTGNALSAAGALQNVAAGCHLAEVSLITATAAIVGAAGNVGSACARLLAPMVKRLILVDINQRNLRVLFDELSGAGTIVEMAATPDSIVQADIVIAVTNAPGAIVKAEHLKPGAIVVDAAQPKNVADKVPQQRKDVLVMESSIFRFPGIEYAFDLGIGSGEALGCMAETIVLAAAGGNKNYSIGKLSAKQVVDVYTAARLLGVKIGFFRTISGLVDENRLHAVKEARRTYSSGLNS